MQTIQTRHTLKSVIIKAATAALFLLIIMAFSTSGGCTIKSIARGITFGVLTQVEADLDESNKVIEIATIGLSMVANSKEPEAIREAIYELIESRFAGSGQGFIRLIYAEVGEMIMSRIDLAIPQEYRDALEQALQGVVQGAEFYMEGLPRAQ